MSTNPAVWRTALLSVVAALVSAGVIAPELGDQINQWVGIAVIVATAVLPVVGALWSKTRTAPVAAGTPAAKVLVRNADGVYAASSVLPAPNPVGGNVGVVTPPTTQATGAPRLGGDTAPPD